VTKLPLSLALGVIQGVVLRHHSPPKPGFAICCHEERGEGVQQLLGLEQGNPGGKLSLTPWYVGEYDCMLTASSILACCVVRDWIEREIV